MDHARDDVSSDPTSILVGPSEAMRRLRQLIEKVAASPSSMVLVTGESGTGKDLVAHLIHARSARQAAPFVNVTCSAIPETLLESELFGHERGAFTDACSTRSGLIESAHRGTLFLDEVAEMSPRLQAKLLRFVEERRFRRVGGAADIHPDIRLVAATHRDLAAAVVAGTLRADFFYRLVVVQVHIPPLRERPEDILPLARHFLRRFAAAVRRRPCRLTLAAERLLVLHQWPGNVRELRNALERADALAAPGAELDAAAFQGLTGRQARLSVVLPLDGIDLGSVERDLLRQALRRAGGDPSGAGQLLGLTRCHVRQLLASHGLGAAAAAMRAPGSQREDVRDHCEEHAGEERLGEQRDRSQLASLVDHFAPNIGRDRDHGDQAALLPQRGHEGQP